MKDYLAGTKYTDEQKKWIMKCAKLLYCQYAVGNKGRGWNVCEDDERIHSIAMARSIFSELTEPYVNQCCKVRAKEMKERIKKYVIENL